MELLRLIEGIRTPFLDTLFELITMLGEEMILILVFCLLFWCINKRMAYVMGIVFFVSGLAVQGAKVIFRVPRPWIADPTFTPVPGALHYATGYAFPSGHTQAGASLLGSLGAQLRPIVVKVVLFTLAVLVGFSRMYLGVHTISDVIVSLVITFSILVLTLNFFPKDGTEINKKHEFIWSLSIFLFAVAVLVLAAVMYLTGTVDHGNVRDSVIVGGSSIGFAVGMYVERVYIRFSVKSKNIFLQILKFVIGVAGTLALQEGLRIFGSGLVMDAIRYFFMVTWITLFFPLIIKRFFSIPGSN